MDAQQFLAEFGHIANAPGGVHQLREMIYQLAITGKLTAQFDADGDAHELLAEIAALKGRLTREKAYKRLPKLEAEVLNIPSAIELPATWCWTRLLDVGEISPRNDAPDEADASFIPMSGFSEFHKGALAPEARKWGHIKKGYTHFRNGDVVVAKITPCFENGKAAVIDGLAHSIGAGTTELHVFRPIHSGILSGYIYLFLRSPYFAVEGEKNMTGTAGQKRLPTEYFATRALPLPPTNEQSRIIVKVDELMTLCDKLEAQQQARRKQQNALRQSILQAVASSQSAHELQTAWARLADNFEWLFHAPEDLIDLDQCIKQLALKGLLSVRAEGEMVNSEVADLTRTSTAAVSDSEMDWSIPDHWIWARCAWLGEARLGKMLDAAKNKGDFRPYLRNINVRWGGFDLSDVLQMRVEEHELLKVSVRKGDLVICEGGEPGRAAVWSDEEEFVIQKALHRFRCNEHVLPEYILFCLEHDYFSGRLSRYFTGATIKHLTGRALAEYPIPLPPVDEQKRILVAANELMRSVSTLKDRLIAINRCSVALAAASVASLIGIAIEQEEEPMKAPQTELIAPLRLGTAPDIKALAPLATILARHNGEMSAKDLWQRFGGEIDAFYAQLKIEVAYGWILEPAPAEMREKPADMVNT
ncbi:restriction endonuclease subunit S [Pseudomonas aeruginosa]|uniref:restriction endonuclease subunit S n=1 Tax=Pseudomonas aeruginosa TaxID=287 RepID=UPI000FC427E1|nr:restriction endonuclease subunit S [Pseudomonas aeruginosa]QTQ95613.1 restriction endonuclease subunit S [Pseudomonas aeruginosa]RUD95586.1 restriction endonuclease subunit S [Pseudomonas aeruginosa]HBP5742614.1 restriction endonuclease subunit S [Pseudomonas aeruginosa]